MALGFEPICVENIFVNMYKAIKMCLFTYGNPTHKHSVTSSLGTPSQDNAVLIQHHAINLTVQLKSFGMSFGAENGIGFKSSVKKLDCEPIQNQLDTGSNTRN